ncbi:MAG: hypothetical protein MUO63_14515 [Desulfobulbaceae bacterium]|nr:hypothetical protein [Desulfobulbaceae bacterium]
MDHYSHPFPDRMLKSEFVSLSPRELFSEDAQIDLEFLFGQQMSVRFVWDAESMLCIPVTVGGRGRPSAPIDVCLWDSDCYPGQVAEADTVI